MECDWIKLRKGEKREKKPEAQHVSGLVPTPHDPFVSLYQSEFATFSPSSCVPTACPNSSPSLLQPAYSSLLPHLILGLFVLLSLGLVRALSSQSGLLFACLFFRASHLAQLILSPPFLLLLPPSFPRPLLLTYSNLVLPPRPNSTSLSHSAFLKHGSRDP